jgi:hypothetical protein
MKRFARCPDALPPVAFAAHPTTGATIMIRRGERRYYVLPTHLTADELNQVFSVTAAQAMAMLAGSRFGWGCRAADPATYAGASSCDSIADTAEIYSNQGASQ